MSAPTVTIGIPLYAALPWLDRISGNIDALTGPGIEFVLSDRHGLDDAVERLRTRYAGRPDVRIETTDDGQGWIANYNHLLGLAHGDYFRILTQDDVLPRASLDAAVAALDAEPDAVLATGPADLIDPIGAIIEAVPRRPASQARHGCWTRAVDALRLYAGRHSDVNLALVRRRIAAEHALWIPQTAGASGLSVRAWSFALSLRGYVRQVPAYVSRRCVHPDSYTARHWRRSPIAQIARSCSYMQAGVAAWCAVHRGLLVRAAGIVAIAAVALVVMPLRRIIARATPQFRRVSAAQATNGKKRL